MPVLMVFETINELSCASLEFTSCAYMYFVLWHVNIYNNVMFDMFYVICLCAACGTNFDVYVPHVALITNFQAQIRGVTSTAYSLISVR